MRQDDHPKEPKPARRQQAIRRSRAGWVEAFAKAGELTDEDLAWLQFDNEGDDELQW